MVKFAQCDHGHWRSGKSTDCWWISRLKWLLVCFQSRISASHDRLTLCTLIHPVPTLTMKAKNTNDHCFSTPEFLVTFSQSNGNWIEFMSATGNFLHWNFSRASHSNSLAFLNEVACNHEIVHRYPTANPVGGKKFAFHINDSIFFGAGVWMHGISKACCHSSFSGVGVGVGVGVGWRHFQGIRHDVGCMDLCTQFLKKSFAFRSEWYFVSRV